MLCIDYNRCTIPPRHHLPTTLIYVLCQQVKMKTMQQDATIIPHKKLKYDDQVLLYFKQKKGVVCMYMYIKSMYNTIFLYSFILDTSDDDDGTGSGVDCKLLWVIRVCNYGLLKNGVFS